MMAESNQLIFQQKKATKQISLVRQKEQYTELLVRKIRKYQALQMTDDALYSLMRQQLPLLEKFVVMNIQWWRPEKGSYSNLFYYLDNRYFNLKGLIQYEIILSSKQSVVVGLYSLMVARLFLHGTQDQAQKSPPGQHHQGGGHAQGGGEHEHLGAGCQWYYGGRTAERRRGRERDQEHGRIRP